MFHLKLEMQGCLQASRPNEVEPVGFYSKKGLISTPFLRRINCLANQALYSLAVNAFCWSKYCTNNFKQVQKMKKGLLNKAQLSAQNFVLFPISVYPPSVWRVIVRLQVTRSRYAQSGSQRWDVQTRQY